MKNIVLVGMMGAGKTTTGALLSKRLNRKLIDIDMIIEQREQKNIIDIFKYDGEEAFRKLEVQTIQEFSTLSDLVISPGGGAIEKADNLSNLQKNGVVIYLKADIEELFSRVKKDYNRPLLQKKDPLEALRKLVQKREKFYQLADMTVVTDGKNPEQVADEIIEALSKYE